MSSLVMGVIKEIRAQQSLVGDEANLRRPTVLLDNGAAIAIGEELGSQAARSLLDELRDKNVPIAFRMGEIGATEVFIVQRWVVKEILDEDATGVAVEFLISHARHVLPRENPDFDRIMDELRRSHQLGDSVMVAEDDGHHILEVWRSGAQPKFLKPAEGQPGGTGTPLTNVTSAQAQALFISMQQSDCDVGDVVAPCIPFDFPDDGCWGRAHEMCRRIAATGTIPGKVWNYGRLMAASRNNPKCAVQWFWHVAPTLSAAGADGVEQTVVLDPSLFDRVVSVEEWHAVQGDAAAQLASSSWEIFHRNADGASTTDPTFGQTEHVLQTYRLALKARIAQSGPPPYAACQLL